MSDFQSFTLKQITLADVSLEAVIRKKLKSLFILRKAVTKDSIVHL